MTSPKQGYRRLMEVTDLGERTVKEYIRLGILPGYIVGRSYVVPDELVDRFVRGEWTPRPLEPVKALPTAVDFLAKRKDAAS